jgi:hypothetical protein
MYSTHMPVLNIWTWPRGDVLSLRLIDGDVGLLRGELYTFFSKSPTEKNSDVKRV